MKIRDSGMPDQEYWASFFDAERLIHSLFGGMPCDGDVLEYGSGYGTFSLPAARYTAGRLTALDIEPELVSALQALARKQGVSNIQVKQADFMREGAGVQATSQSHVMIYNLLHLENPLGLLRQAYDALKPGGRLSIIHWRCDIPTPRGPPLDIRPTPEDCQAWTIQAGFAQGEVIDVSDYCPYHYALVAIR